MIGVIILNYNTYQQTILLTEELQSQTVSKDLTIIIVDNASPNNSFQHLVFLEEKYDNVKVLQMAKNLGYAKGNNFGLNYLHEHVKPDYVSILNNDIILKKDCFSNLIERYAVLPNPGIIAPLQLDHNKQVCLPNKMHSFLDDCLSLFYIFKLFNKRKAYKIKDNTGLKALRVDMIPGSFMFSSFKTFKKMGFFYPNTFLFAEERFIAMKAKALNLKNYILLDETYIHFHSKTINTQHSKISKYNLMYASWLEFTKVHRTNPNFKLWILKNLMKLSIIEMHFFHKVKIFLKDYE